MQRLQYDTVYHEHLRYYSLTSLAHLLAMHGLEVFRARAIPTHGGSIRVYAARRGMRPVRDTVAASAEHAEVVPFSAKIEAELSELPLNDRAEFLQSLGIESAGLDRLIRAGYHLLGLHTYFTAGEPEVRAWTIHRGDTAPQAAGVIHTDFERGFIRAETVGYDDFLELDGWKGAREKGAVRSEGKEYVVKDGDVMLFRFNV